MPKFTFQGPIELYYPTLGVTAQPGDVVDLAEAPDAYWEPSAPVAVAAPSTSTPQEN